MNGPTPTGAAPSSPALAAVGLLALGLMTAPGCGSSLVGGECQAGLEACGGRCVDLRIDPEHCGACGNACASGVCSAGMCMPGGLDGGPSDAQAGDAGPGRDGSGPGDASLDGRVGRDGSLRDGSLRDGSPRDGGVPDGRAGDGSMGGDDGGAGTGCDIGEFLCNGRCVDLLTDRMFCGECDNFCEADEFCAEGRCLLDCDPPLTACGDVCLDLSDDPDNCGSCGRQCESGICRDEMCVAPEAGHVVVVGHDYRSSRRGMNRVAGNALFLGRGNPVRTVVFGGDAAASSIAGIDGAIDQVAASTGRSWTRIEAAGPDVPLLLDDADAFIIYPQRATADEVLTSLGTEWSVAFESFLRRGGVLVAFETEGPSSGTYRVFQAAGQFEASGRSDVSGADLEVVAPGDAVGLGVPLMYRGEETTVRFEDTVAPVVVTHPDGPVVLHRVVAP